jgi:hypothetical protein
MGTLLGSSEADPTPKEVSKVQVRGVSLAGAHYLLPGRVGWLGVGGGGNHDLAEGSKGVGS